MRILIVTTSFPAPDSDGSEAAGSFVRDFSVLLSGRADVSVVCPHTAESREAGPPEVRRFAVRRLPLGGINPVSPFSWPQIASVLTSGQDAVDSAAGEFRPDHILALWSLPSGWWARKAARRLQVGYSTWSLGSDIWSLGRIPVVRSALKSVLAGSRFRFADGLGLCSDVERICGRKCLFLPSSRSLGIVEPSAKRSSPPYRLAFLGRWHRNKGVDLLLEALRRLAPADWQRIEEMRIHGGGQLEPEVKRACVSLCRGGRPVRVGGYLDRDGASALFAWADMVVIPSRVESIPVVFSDAMQAGCRIVATPVGDLPALVDGSIGTLSGDVSPAGIASAISRAVAGEYGTTDGMEKTRAMFDPAAAVENLLCRIGTAG